MFDERIKALYRRVCLEHGFSSDQIDRGEISEGDADLLLQPIEAITQWVHAATGGNDQEYFESFVKLGILQEVTSCPDNK